MGKQFTSILDKHFPYMAFETWHWKVKNSYAPYIDKELRHKMFQRDLYKKRFNKNKSPEGWQKFKEFRNTINRERPEKKIIFFTKNLMRLRTISRIPGKY